MLDSMTTHSEIMFLYIYIYIYISASFLAFFDVHDN
jgi:hypothetical protein